MFFSKKRITLHSTLMHKKTHFLTISFVVGFFFMINTSVYAHIKCPIKLLGTTNDKCPHLHRRSSPSNDESYLGGRGGLVQPTPQQEQTYRKKQQRKIEEEQRRRWQEQQRRQAEINRRNAETFFYLCVKNNYEKCSSIYQGRNKRQAQSVCRGQGYPEILFNKSQQYLDRVTKDNCFISTFTMPVR